MRRILVIGIGSLIMKDDGIGPRVVEAIKDSLREHKIEFFIGETDFQCCFDEIKPDDFLIIIDAMSQGKVYGSVDVMPLIDAIKNRSKIKTQHELSLFDLIELHYPKAQGYFVGIEVAEIGLCFELSKPLIDCFEQICVNVLNTVLYLKEEREDGR